MDTCTIRASIAMAVYNGEKYISEQIESIRKLLEKNDEIVVSYDNSDDNTLEIINNFVSIDSRIRVVFDEGKSVESNFNTAVLNCKGKYIFLADQDDVWINDKVNKMCDYFDNHPKTVVLIGNGYTVDKDLNIKDDLFKLFKVSTNPIHNFVKGTYLGCQMAFVSKIKDLVWPVRVSPPLPHDLWLGIFSAFYGEIDLFKDYTILHRLHDNNYTLTSKMSLINVIKNRILFFNTLVYQFVKNLKKK